MAEYVKTFGDIVDAIIEEVGIQSSDTTMVNRIKRDINFVYMQKVVPAASNWHWLRKEVSLIHESAITGDTASVTNGSKTVTITTTQTFSLEGFWISFGGDRERYRVESNTAASATLKLDQPYLGTTNTEAGYTLWTDRLSLPPDCSQVTDVYVDGTPYPIENRGYKEIKEMEAGSPFLSSMPCYYTTLTYKDPDLSSSVATLPASATRLSSGLIKTIKFNATLGADEDDLLLQVGDKIVVTGAGEESYNTEAFVIDISTTTNANDTIKYIGDGDLTQTSTADTGITVEKINNKEFGEGYRELLIYPSINSVDVLFHVTYQKLVPPLSNDSDEPAMPLQDIDVLVYGALARVWKKMRNAEESAENAQLFREKLAQMKARFEDSPGKLQFRPSTSYLNYRRSQNTGWSDD